MCTCDVRARAHVGQRGWRRSGGLRWRARGAPLGPEAFFVLLLLPHFLRLLLLLFKSLLRLFAARVLWAQHRLLLPLRSLASQQPPRAVLIHARGLRRRRRAPLRRGRLLVGPRRCGSQGIALRSKFVSLPNACGHLVLCPPHRPPPPPPPQTKDGHTCTHVRTHMQQADGGRWSGGQAGAVYLSLGFGL